MCNILWTKVLQVATEATKDHGLCWRCCQPLLWWRGTFWFIHITVYLIGHLHVHSSKELQTVTSHGNRALRRIWRVANMPCQRPRRVPSRNGWRAGALFHLVRFHSIVHFASLTSVGRRSWPFSACLSSLRIKYSEVELSMCQGQYSWRQATGICTITYNHTFLYRYAANKACIQDIAGWFGIGETTFRLIKWVMYYLVKVAPVVTDIPSALTQLSQALEQVRTERCLKIKNPS